jgi:hypothetical protein
MTAELHQLPSQATNLAMLNQRQRKLGQALSRSFKHWGTLDRSVSKNIKTFILAELLEDQQREVSVVGAFTGGPDLISARVAPSI